MLLYIYHLLCRCQQVLCGLFR